MIRFFRDWIEHRTGLGKVVDAMLLEGIPGGAKWRYVWGSALMMVFSIQVITGVLLMTAYSPGDSTAWGSVYFIQYEMDFGWLIRGLHHFGSQTMVVLLGIHMLQVVIAGAHLNPREMNWWLGLGLAGVVLGLSLTGYLLPWDQKGFYATQVATNIAGGIKYVGPFIQKVAVGGPEYGNHTLTRFFGLHVAILPGILIALLVAHIWVFRRHGVTHPKNPVSHGWFWPDQAFRDMVVGLLVFGIMLGLVIYGWGNKIEPTPGVERSTYDKIAHAGRDGRGANLDAPADPRTDYPARPEWYFLPLFQLLKYFPGDQSYIGTLVIPGAIAAILFILPLLGYGKLRPLGHLLAVIVVVALLGGAAYLTAQAWVEDQAPATFDKQPYKLLKDAVASKRYNEEAGKNHQKHMDEAERRAQRAVQLAAAGSPAAGSRLLLRNDPMTAGKDLFRTNCASCHQHFDDDPHSKTHQMSKDPTASDLTDWGTKEWIKGLLTDPNSDKYFGRSHLKDGKMAKWVTGGAGKKAAADFDAIAEWLGSHPRKDAPSDDDQSDFAKGFRKFDAQCSECHTYKPKEPISDMADAPDFTGYGDAQWLREMIMLPQHPSKYGAKNRMPGFRDVNSPAGAILEEPFKQRAKAAVDAADKPDAKAAAQAAHKVIALTDLERELIIRFVLKDDRVVFGGEPISGPPEKK